MLAGTPVVASRTGGIPDVIDHGRTGWFVQPGNPAALAGALCSALRDPCREQSDQARGVTAGKLCPPPPCSVFDFSEMCGSLRL